MTIDTTKLRELAMKATPGPWLYELSHGSYLRIYSASDTDIVTGCGCCGSPNCDDADASFIAAVNPATMLQLLDEIDRQKRMFYFACVDLAAINERLGLDPDDGGAEPILHEIDRLKSELNGAAECIARQAQTIARLLEIEKAARNLQKAKGRHNTEIAMNRLQATLAASE